MFGALLLAAVFLTAQPEETSARSSPEQRLAFARRSAQRYRFVTDPQTMSSSRLHPQPLLRWDNQVVHEDDGLLFLWAEKNGRPLVAAQFFLQGENWHHEFQSLSGSGFEAGCDGVAEWAWHPRQGGLKLAAAPESDPPAKAAAARLRQMRGIAEKYSGAVDVDRSETVTNLHELRLLTTPVYRYADEEIGLVDGAIFAFVQGTNPEVLLILEAHRQRDETEWRFGFAPMTSFPLRVRRDEKIVFEREQQNVPTLDLDDSYHFRWAVEKDGSVELKAEAK